MDVDIVKIVVVGAGTMGSGIAQALAEGGYSVGLADLDLRRAEQGMSIIRRRLDRRAAAGRMSVQDKEELLSRITPLSGPEDWGDAGLFVEAASERETIKQTVFRQLDAVAPDPAILASNTSAISITRLAAATGRPERFIGMHFMNPAHVMKLVEVIPGLRTAPETVTAVIAVCRRVGKEPVVVADAPGFVANRLLMPVINEAIGALQEGLASREDIDTVAKLGANHPMGPLELADFIGLDICLEILETLHAELGERFLPAPLLRRMVAAGKLGRKSGEGFYEYR